MTSRSASKILLAALGFLLAVGGYVAARETMPPERAVSIEQLACCPAEPPVSRMGCSP